MQPWWMAQQVAEEHRRDLATSARFARSARSARSGTRWDGRRTDLMVDTEAGRDHCDPDPSHQEPGPTPRRAIAPSVGALLIRMGTRLGGTSMRTS
jgi:hypothetical protein